MKKAKFILKTRESPGTFTVRSCMGTRTGMRWGKWRTIGKWETKEDAQRNLESFLVKNPSLFNQYEIFHKGKKITDSWEKHNGGAK